MSVVTIRRLPSGLGRWAPDCCPDVGRFIAAYDGVGPSLMLDAPGIFLHAVVTNRDFPLRFCPWCGASWAGMDWTEWRQEFVTKEERALRWEKTGRFSTPTTKTTPLPLAVLQELAAKSGMLPAGMFMDAPVYRNPDLAGEPVTDRRESTLPVLRAVITDTEATGQAERLPPALPPRYRLEDTSIESMTERSAPPEIITDAAACPVVAVQMHTSARLACRLPKGHDGPHDYS